MRILMFNYEYPPLGGGGGVVHQHIAEELAKRHEVMVVTTGCKGLASAELVGGVDVRRLKVIGRNSRATASLVSMLSYFFVSLRAGQRLISDWKPDVINTHFAVPTGPSSSILASRNDIPHALCIHGGDIYDPSKRMSPHRNPVLRKVVRWVLRKVDRVLAQSKNTVENAQRIYGYDKDIAIIPHGLERPKGIPESSREELGLRDDQMVLVTVGRLVKRKANHELIEVLARINNPRLQLVILGDGPEKEALGELAERLGVAEQVSLAGFVSEEKKFQYLQAADVYVSTTSHEGFGLMYIEAMFCKLPIITYDHGGQSDFLEDEKTGFLVPVGNRGLFEERLRQLIDDADLRKKTGEYCLALSDEYEIGHCAARYEAVFEEMIGGKEGSDSNRREVIHKRMESVG